MKRIVCIVCLLAPLLCACSIEEQTPTIPEGDYDYGIYQLTFNEKRLSNDCVGNDWSFTYTHNGQTIKIGSAYLPGLRCPIFSAAVTAALKI